MCPLRTDTPRWLQLAAYCLLLGLLVAQVLACLHTHAIVGRLTMTDTLLFVIALGRNLRPNASIALDLYLLLAGIVAFEALVFVNFTHALELFFCAEGDSHFSHFFLYVTVVDVVVKAVLLLAGQLPSLELGILKRLLLHFVAPSATLAMAFVNAKYSADENEYLILIDPYLSTFLCAVLTLIALPQFVKHIPYLMANQPEEFRLEEFKDEIEKQFPGTRCVHVHVFRKWPGAAFDAIIHVSIDTDQTDANWSERIQLKWIDIQSTVQSVLRRAGADRVTVQPHFEGVFSNLLGGTLPKAKSAASWRSCVSDECDEKEKTCCRTLENDEEQASEEDEAIPVTNGIAKTAENGFSAVSSV